jgi:translation initiation factor 2 subunit 3
MPTTSNREHLAAAEVSGIKNMIIVQNKIDIVDQKRALESYKEIKAFVKGTVAENAPIIPISAQRNINIDVLLEAIQTIIPTPKRDPNVPPLMYIIRSFDIKQTGNNHREIEGGIIGGTIVQGKFAVGEEIEIRPGIMAEREGKTVYDPLISEIVTLHAGDQRQRSHMRRTRRRRHTTGSILLKSRRFNRQHSRKNWATTPNRDRNHYGNHVLERAVGTKELLES